jgi:hypothetical protein
MIDFRLEKTGQDPMLALSGELTVESCEALKKEAASPLTSAGSRLSMRRVISSFARPSGRKAVRRRKTRWSKVCPRG